MTPVPTFEQVVSVPRLYVLSSVGDAPVPFWAGYLPTDRVAPGETMTLDQAWQDAGGCYVFLGAEPTSLMAFSGSLAGMLKRLSPSGHVRILWIENPNDLDSQWRYWPVQCAWSGQGPSIAWNVLRTAVLALGEYAVQLPRGTGLCQAPGSLGSGVAFTALIMAAPGGSFAADPTTSWLPFAGPTVGCLRAAITLQGGDGDGLAALRTQLCFAAPRNDGCSGDGVDTLGMSVMAQGAAAVRLHLSFDPTHPLSAARSRLGFFDDQGAGPAPMLPATLRTSNGHVTTLTPRAAGPPLRPAALAFGRSPLTCGDRSAFTYHLCPEGAFTLEVDGPPGATGHRVMFGGSAQEYVLLPAGQGTVFFAPGRPAMVPGAAPQQPPDSSDTPLLNDAAVTSYMTVLPTSSAAPGLPYYAQPPQASLHDAHSSVLPTGFLSYLELPAATLPSWAAGTGHAPETVPATLPAGADASEQELALRVDAALAAARRRTIGIAPTGHRDPGGGTEAVTPQGLLVTVQSRQIDSLVVANMPATPQPRLELTSLGPQMRTALSSAELFMVVADPDTYLSDSSVPYLLDEVGLRTATARGVPEGVVEQLRARVIPGGVPKRFEDEHAFVSEIQSIAPDHVALLTQIGGLLRAVMSGWAVDLAPRAWRGQRSMPTPEDAPTIMLLKFAHRSLEKLVDDTGAWTWREAARLPVTGEQGTQAELRSIFTTARARMEDPTVQRDDPYVAFYRDVVADPGWNGVLFVNAPVEAGRLPEALQFLAGGVDHSAFYAHHIGFSATPVKMEGGSVALGQTAAFGLIDYRDPYDLTLDPSDPHPVPFAFKTLRLTARFSNAALAGFTARVELMVNQLLGAELTKLEPAHGNNLVLAGSLLTTNNGPPTCDFTLEGVNRYGAGATVLDTIDISSVSVLAREGSAGPGEVTTRFLLGGKLRMIEFPRFDPFGYGPTVGKESCDGWLRFDGLAVDMTTPLEPATRPRFSTDLTAITLDAAESNARANSLVSRFPVRLAGFAASDTQQRPEDLGYAPVDAQLEQQPLPGPWFGLLYVLDLGTLGDLTGGQPLTLDLLAAWGPATEPGACPAFLGLKLPGYANGSFSWPLQGVLKLGFRSLRFETAEITPGVRSYALRLHRLGLSALGLSFPPGTTDLVLFGPSSDEKRNVVGWYAAYANDKHTGGELPR
ncbi:hypothetical protein [Streptomyces spirodelae]|uniref:Uncharacterized protein n=1 Tax=Streptomyces spirodelae TaxID=2812904 RepID=A0ABS3WTH4_9ACTN|nr:hypothetical protein [Streptomyces spirodelae]MBO8186408.1 hypothetical protein [Streptomyces spirodelae]